MRLLGRISEAVRGGSRRGGLGGQVLPILAICIVALMAFAAVGVDMSGAYRLQADQREALAYVKEYVEAAAPSRKYTSGIDSYVDDAKAAIANTGWGGSYTIRAYELSAGQTGSHDRVIGVEVALGGTYHTWLGGFVGRESIGVNSHVTVWVNHYSKQALQVPAPGSPVGKMVTSDGASVSQTWGDLPGYLQSAINTGLANRSGGRGADVAGDPSGVDGTACG